MMTSRSEYRLLLRQDNADARLTPIGYKVGLVDEARYNAFLKKQANIKGEIARLHATHLSPARANPLLEELSQAPVASGVSLADLLRRPALSYRDLAPLDNERPTLTRSEELSVEVQIKYEGYIDRQIAEVSRHERLESRMLPSTLDYQEIKGLRIEAIQKLNKIKPQTVGQAARISGVSPADISVLLIYLGIH